MSTITASRYHDISCGHRVYKHESKCRHAHGHNYRIHFNCLAPSLDEIGRVIDFSVIKSTLCEFLETEWDHKFLLWDQDPGAEIMRQFDAESVKLVPFNPTAENMARYLVEIIGPQQLAGTGVILHSVTIEETRKCSASYSC